ncbi:MAG: HlyD family efflux transporter periplasmic adaptor subunit [Chloroflexi bacterium]|nr:HlyD family efflux transporter periplasmic adaptor subunit [Chloroflexota bacterium]
MKRGLFRASALEHIRSPEQLDRLLVVTKAPSWLALLALLTLAAAAVVWGLTGTVQITSTGQGVLLRGGDVRILTATSSGQLVNLSVEPGDLLNPDEPIGVINSGDEEVIEVFSPFPGRVLKIDAEIGNFIAVGSPILTIELSRSPFEAVIFMSSIDSQDLTVGTPVQVLPSDTPTEEYGYLIGEVADIAEFPSSNQAIARLLGDAALASELTANGQTIRIDVALRETEDTPSGYEWSSVSGPPTDLQSGSLTSARFILNEVRPASLLFLSQ